jgi:hypothetical protein
MNFQPGKYGVSPKLYTSFFPNSGSEIETDTQNRPKMGTSGIPVSNGRNVNDMISPPTPVSTKTPRTPHSSVHSSPRNDQRKSRPPSNMTSPMSADGHSRDNYSDHKHVRLQSLDERVSSLEAESRQHTDASDHSDDEDKLAIVEQPNSFSPASNNIEVITALQMVAVLLFNFSAHYELRVDLRTLDLRVRGLAPAVVRPIHRM